MNSQMFDTQELERMISKNRMMTPSAKGLAGMILFKIDNDIPLDSKEEQFFEGLQTFLKYPS